MLYYTFLRVQCSPKIHKNFMLGSKSHEFTVVHILVHNSLFLFLRKKGNITITRAIAIGPIESVAKSNYILTASPRLWGPESP